MKNKTLFFQISDRNIHCRRKQYKRKKRRRIPRKEIVLDDTPGPMWGPQRTLHVRCSSFEWAQGDIWQKIFHAPENTHAGSGLPKAVWVGCALSGFPVWLEAWSQVWFLHFLFPKWRGCPRKSPESAHPPRWQWEVADAMTEAEEQHALSGLAISLLCCRRADHRIWPLR